MNRKTSHIVFTITCLFCSLQTVAQENIAVLSWQTHFSYNNIQSVTAGEDKVFAAGQHGIFFVDQADNSVNLINKNNGLSDVDITAIHYDESIESLIIGYRDGGIDFWSEGNTRALTTVEEATIRGSKAFRNIQSFEQSIYFTGDLGIVVYDKQREQIVESYLNLGQNGEPLAINALHFQNDSIYAMSADGILSVLNSPEVNLQDFNNWRRSLTGLSFSHVKAFNNELYAASGPDIFLYDGTSWNYFASTESDVRDLEVTNGRITALAGNRLYQNFGNTFVANKTIPESNVIFDNGSFLWAGTTQLGLSRIVYIQDGFQSFKPQGPVNDLTIKSFREEEGTYFMYEKGFSRFNTENRTWTADNTGVDDSRQLTDLDFKVRLPSELESPILADFNQGLFVTNQANNLIFNSDQPSITRSNNSYTIQAVEGEVNDLWILVRNNGDALHKWNIIFDEWTAYELDNARARFSTDLFIATNGDKWISIDESQGGGIVVFNENTLRERYLNNNGGQGGIPGRQVNDIVYDEDEFLWMATSGGVAFYPNADDVLDGRQLTANIPIFENRLLLRNEHITSISVDPANRKWFGSLNNGLWLFSETGEELIFHFTKDNSPLPSNQIIDLSLNPASGELFISTDKGIVSFRGDATIGQPTHENVKLYPNPVNPNFNGNVVLEGLVNNARLKITDVSGKIVRELRANGSTATWNVRDQSNARVSTGVYLVFSSNRDGTETYVGKIVVI